MMKVKEAINRLPKNWVGVRIIVPNNGKYQFGGREMYIRFLSPTLIWLCEDRGLSNKKIYPVECKYHDFLDWEISSQNDFLINDGDETFVNGSAYSLGKKERVVITNVCEGDATPYPFRVKFKDGRRGQYKKEELGMIIKPSSG